jgi:hypothetical protein
VGVDRDGGRAAPPRARRRHRATSAFCPEQPGQDLSVRDVDAGVALVDPENPDAWLWAPRSETYRVGLDGAI